MYMDPVGHCLANAGQIVKCVREVAEFKNMSSESLKKFISNDLLPELIDRGKTNAVIKLVNEFDIDFLKAGRMDYVGNGESAGPGNYAHDNLVMLAMQEGNEELVEFFLATLIKRGEKAEKIREVVEDTDAWEIYEDLVKRRQRERVKIVRRALPANISYIHLPKYLEEYDYPQYSKKNITKLMGWSKPEKPGSAMYSRSGNDLGLANNSNTSNTSNNNGNNSNNSNTTNTSTRGGKRHTRKVGKHRKARTYRHRRQTLLRQ